MTPKQYLQQLQKIAIRMSALRDEVIRMRSRLESTTVPLKKDRVQSSSKGDAFADAIAIMADKSVQYEELLTIYEGMRQRIIEQILALDDLRSVEILSKRYVQGKGMIQIAEEMHYSRGYVSVLHSKALRQFAEKYQDLFF